MLWRHDQHVGAGTVLTPCAAIGGVTDAPGVSANFGGALNL